MRCENHVVPSQKPSAFKIWHLASKYVQRNPRHPACIKRLHKMRLINQTAACNIYDHRSPLHLFKCFTIKKVPVLVGQIAMQADDIGLSQQLLELDATNTSVSRLLDANLGITPDNVKLTALCPLSNAPAYPPDADDSQSLPG